MKPPQDTSKPILYLMEIGDICPAECNYYFNPGMSLLRNMEFIELNQSRCDYLEMASEMSIQEKYMYRLSSKVRTVKTHRCELSEIFNQSEQSIKRLESGYLGYLDQNLHFHRH